MYASYFVAPGKRFNGEIVAIKLDGSGEAEDWVHYHGLTPGCYRCEAHPAPSRDGKRVLFASNWATDCGDSCGAVADVKAYVVQFADTAEDTVPKPPIDHRFGLRRIYPNPTSVVPSVVYSLREGAGAELVLVDLLGRVVLRRELGAQGPGEHEVVLDRSRVPAGIYWLRLREAGHVASARIVVLK